MTREEAMSYIIPAIERTWNDKICKQIKEVLNEQPCEDAISRQAAIDTLTKTSGIRGDALKAMYDLPPVSVAEKVGHNCNEDYADCDQFVCSECGIELQDWNRVERDEDDGEISYHEYTFNYCPNCGVRIMESEE